MNITDLFNELKSNGVTYRGDDLDKHPREVLTALYCIPSWLYDEVSLCCMSHTDLEKALNQMSKCGKLSFDPYIKRHEGQSPELVLSYKRYVTFKYGDYTMISTENGGTEVSVSTIKYHDVKQAKDLPGNEKLLFDFMRLVSCCFKNDKFRAAIDERNPVILNYLKETSTSISASEVTLENLLNICKPILGYSCPENAKKFYRIPHNDNSDYATIECYDHYIRFNFPNESVTIDRKDCVAFTSDRYLILALVGYVLNMHKVQMQWNSCRALYERDIMPTRNYENLEVFNMKTFCLE